MKFKILKHTYENTGGGCMCGFDEVWLIDEDRTIFAATNESGCTFHTVDTYHHGIDDTDACFDWVNTDDPNAEKHRYFKLAKACYNLYLQDEPVGYADYLWLSDEIRQEITPEYKKWVEEEDCTCFEISRGRLVIDERYKAPPNPEVQVAHCLPYIDLIGALLNFRDAYVNLCSIWQRFDDSKLPLHEEYPFHLSFDELGIMNWIDAGIENIVKLNIVEEILKIKEEM